MSLFQQKSLSEINVTSLVDVTLVLLIIFMITSPLMQMGIQVNLPRASSKAIETKGNLTITVRKDATVYVDDRLIPISSLGEEFASGLAEGKKGVIIRADQAVPYGAVIRVLDVTRKAGIHDVGLITELEQDTNK